MRRLSFVAYWLLTVLMSAAAGAQATEQNVVVSAREAGEEFEEPGGYGQPQWAERSRASATTKLYVLSPYEFFVGVLSETDLLRHGSARHHLVQEIELGIPNRFEIGIENHIGVGRVESSD